MLNNEQQLYFDNIVNSIKIRLNINIPIVAYNHQTCTNKKFHNTVGMSWGKEHNKVYKITIDESYIIENWEYSMRVEERRRNGIYAPHLENEQIKETICHEIAHIYQWRHCKKHTQITKELLRQIRDL
jgi:hypothetical protein